MFSDPYAIGLLIIIVTVVGLGYALMNIFVSAVSSFHQKAEEEKKKQKEKEKSLKNAA